MIRFLKKYVMNNWHWILLGIYITKNMVEIAYIERHGFFIGGEWLILPLILVTVNLCSDIAADIKKDLFGEEEEN